MPELIASVIFGLKNEFLPKQLNLVQITLFFNDTENS